MVAVTAVLATSVSLHHRHIIVDDQSGDGGAVERSVILQLTGYYWMLK